MVDGYLTGGSVDPASEGTRALYPLRGAFERLQACVLGDSIQAAEEAAVDFASEACFSMRNRLRRVARDKHLVALAAYLRIDELQRACCDIATGDQGSRVDADATEKLVSSTILFEKVAPDPPFTVHFRLADGSRHEALQFASHVFGACSSYFGA